MTYIVQHHLPWLQCTSSFHVRFHEGFAQTWTRFLATAHRFSGTRLNSSFLVWFFSLYFKRPRGPIASLLQSHFIFRIIVRIFQLQRDVTSKYLTFHYLSDLRACRRAFSLPHKKKSQSIFDLRLFRWRERDKYRQDMEVRYMRSAFGSKKANVIFVNELLRVLIVKIT